MNNEDQQSCVIDVHKPRVFTAYPKRVNICHTIKNRLKIKEKVPRKPSDVTLQKYSLPAELPLKKKKKRNDELLLSFTQFAREQLRVRHKQKMAVSIFDSYRIISTDLKNRLYTENPPDDVRTIKDTDEDFFNYVSGRQLTRRDPCYKSYSSIYDYRLRKKIEIGYRNDTIFNIDLNFIKERETYDAMVLRYQEQVKLLDQFILEDYKRSMKFLGKWEEIENRVSLKNIELQNLASEMFTTTSQLVLLDYRYSLQQKYGRFLYYVSPLSWRTQNRAFAQSFEIEANGFDFGNSNEDDSFSVLFEKLQIESTKSYVKPVLYFVQPNDLMNVFETIEIQERYHFMHVWRMRPLAQSFDRAIALLKQKIGQDTAAVASTIKGFAAKVKFSYERSKHLEERFYQILFGWFYQSVGAADVLKLTCHLEFCFEKIFNEKPINMDIIDMAKALEDLAMAYMKRLEEFSGNKLKQAIKQFMKEDKLKHKKITEAAKELRLFARLEHELLLSFAPVSKRELPAALEKKVSFARKSNRQKRSRSKTTIIAAKKLSLSDSEKEYLWLFTDWVENEDPDPYLHRYENCSAQKLEQNPDYYL